MAWCKTNISDLGRTSLQLVPLGRCPKKSTMTMTLSGESFFSSKVPKVLHVLFNLVVKHSPVFFLAVLHIVSEKKEDKTSKHAQ